MDKMLWIKIGLLGILISLSSTAYAFNVPTLSFPNPQTSLPDYYSDNVSTATYAGTIGPQQTYYFNTELTTYFTYDNVGTVSLYINGAFIISWSSIVETFDVKYLSEPVKYLGDAVKYVVQ